MELKPVFTVSELNLYVSLLLGNDCNMRSLTVTGEISGFKRHTSGHLYFTLKDEGASVKCVMFKPNAMRLTFFPKDGMSVRIQGSAGLFQRDGSFQLYADSMTKTGDGALYAAFLQRREELDKLGWFDPSLKKPIPFLPRCIGVVTSKTGAAIEDIKSVTARRFPSMPVLLYPVAVQGAGAAEEIAAAIYKAGKEKLCDVLIVGRGGGSLEDLWAFNEMPVAKAIHECPLPVISAVGHEIDFSIADFTADLRAATPSAAAELAVPEEDALRKSLKDSLQHLEKALLRGVESKRHALELLRSGAGFFRPAQGIAEEKQRLDSLLEGMERSLEKQRQEKENALSALSLRLSGASPRGILKRGFTLAYGENGKALHSVKETAPGQRIAVAFYDGSVQAKIETKGQEHGEE